MPLANLLNAVGGTLQPKVFCVQEMADQGVGHPDFGLYTTICETYGRRGAGRATTATEKKRRRRVLVVTICSPRQQVQKGKPKSGQKPERGVIEVKPVTDDAWLTEPVHRSTLAEATTRVLRHAGGCTDSATKTSMAAGGDDTGSRCRVGPGVGHLAPPSHAGSGRRPERCWPDPRAIARDQQRVIAPLARVAVLDNLRDRLISGVWPQIVEGRRASPGPAPADQAADPIQLADVAPSEAVPRVDGNRSPGSGRFPSSVRERCASRQMHCRPTAPTPPGSASCRPRNSSPGHRFESHQTLTQVRGPS